MGKMTQEIKDRIDEVIESSSGGAGGPVNLTQEDIQNLLGAWDSFFAEQYTEGTPEYIAAQEQARAELVRMAEESPALNFSKEAFTRAVGAAEGTGFTPAQAIQQYYNYDFTGKDDLGLSYGTTITTALENYDPDSDAAQAARNQASVWGDADAGWTPAAPTLSDVQVATDYVAPNQAQLQTRLDAFLPKTRQLGQVTQNTPAFTVADKLPATLFDAINFPERAITRGTPVVTRGLDQFGNPTTAITMGQSTATPTGENIGELNTTAMFPSTGMGIAADGTGTAKVGTLDTTGNVIATGADTLNLFESDDTVTSTVDPNATVLGKGTPVSTTTTVVEDTTPTITCYNDAGQQQVFEGTTCPADFPYSTKPPVGTSTITCYNAAGASQQITGLNPTCPATFPYNEACPTGHTRNDVGQCIEDVSGCTGGKVKNADGNCVCPEGKTEDADGNCVESDPGCTGGKVKDAAGNCVCPEGKTEGADGTCVDITLTQPCPAGQMRDEATDECRDMTNIETVAKIVKETNDALIAQYGFNPTQAQKDEFMQKGKAALVAAAMAGDGLSVTDMALGAQISGATTLLDLDATAGAGATGIDASAQDVFDVVTNEYSQDGNFGSVGGVTVFSDDLSGNTNAQLQSNLSEGIDTSGTAASGAGAGATSGAGAGVGIGASTSSSSRKSPPGSVATPTETGTSTKPPPPP